MRLGVVEERGSSSAKPAQAGLPTPFQFMKLRTTAMIIGATMKRQNSRQGRADADPVGEPASLVPCARGRRPAACAAGRRPTRRALCYPREAGAVAGPSSPPRSSPKPCSRGHLAGARSPHSRTHCVCRFARQLAHDASFVAAAFRSERSSPGSPTGRRSWTGRSASRPRRPGSSPGPRSTGSSAPSVRRCRS